MKKRGIALCGIGLFVIGLLLLLNASKIGINIANSAVQAEGGVMDTEQFYFIMKSNTLSYQIAGALMALLGGAASIVFGFDTFRG